LVNSADIVSALFIFKEICMSTRRREWLFSVVIAIISIGIWFIDIPQVPQTNSGMHSRGLITAVDNSRVRAGQPDCQNRKSVFNRSSPRRAV
jgi:hypothetical protein